MSKKNSQRFKKMYKLALAYSKHPPEESAPSKLLLEEIKRKQDEEKKISQEEEMNNQIREFEETHGFHDMNDERAIKTHFKKTQEQLFEMPDWRNWSI